jgi:hypothetical protein
MLPKLSLTKGCFCELYVSLAQLYDTHHIGNVGRSVHQGFGLQGRSKHPGVYEFVVVGDLGPFGLASLWRTTRQGHCHWRQHKNLLDLGGHNERITWMVHHAQNTH